MKYLLMALALMTFNVEAGYIDLKEGSVMAQGKCQHNGKHMVCVIVEMEEQIYVVLLDEKGEYEIYKITEKESVLIWSRNTV